MDRSWVKSITWQVQDEPNIFVMPVILLDLCDEKRSLAKVRGCDILNSERRCMPGFPMPRSVLRLAVSP